MLGTVITMAFVFATLAVVAYALYEMSPFARHAEHYHEPGQRQQSPHLD
jgi:Na+-transporting methylmalonyl-CoA/oxaloacetate decarboxylase gamma subunit